MINLRMIGLIVAALSLLGLIGAVMYYKTTAESLQVRVETLQATAKANAEAAMRIKSEGDAALAASEQARQTALKREKQARAREREILNATKDSDNGTVAPVLRSYFDGLRQRSAAH